MAGWFQLQEDHDRLREQIIALAGLLQAVTAVRGIAREDSFDVASCATAISSVLRVDAPGTADVFGGEGRLRAGLQALDTQLGATRNAAHNEVARYAASALVIARALEHQPAAGARLRAEFERIERVHESALQRLERAAHDASDGAQASEAMEPLTDELAEIYREHVGAVGPRIMVHGEPSVLKQPRNAARVRVLLLGAVRAAVLWRQLGGNRLKLLLNRGAVRHIVAEMLEQARSL